MSKEAMLSNYVEVKDRIAKFWEKYPNGRIKTQIVAWENEKVVVFAEIFRSESDQHAAATGHAYELEGSTYINKTSALENCETSAVGRALGIMGFEIKKSIASREEVANAQTQQKSIKQKAATKTVDDSKVKQARVIYEQLKGSGNGFETFIRDCDSKGFTIDDIINKLNSKLEESKNE